MIRYTAKTDATPPPVKDVEKNRVEQVQKEAERHRKNDTDGTRRRARQTVDDNQLL